MVRISILLLLFSSLLTVGYCLGEDKPVTTETHNASEPKIPTVKEEFDAKVIDVIEGDTIIVETADKRQVTVRMEGIDAPERLQNHSKRANQVLPGTVLDKVVRIRVTGKDREERTLAYVMLGEQNVNLGMVWSGWAWHFTKYNGERRFSDAEFEARIAKRGLWAYENPIAPWDYRSQGGNKKQPKLATDDGVAPPAPQQ